MRLLYLGVPHGSIFFSINAEDRGKISKLIGSVLPSHTKFTRSYAPRKQVCNKCWSVGHTAKTFTSPTVCVYCRI